MCANGQSRVMFGWEILEDGQMVTPPHSPMMTVETLNSNGIWAPDTDIVYQSYCMNELNMAYGMVGPVKIGEGFVATGKIKAPKLIEETKESEAA